MNEHVGLSAYNIEIFQKPAPIFRRGKFKFSKIKPINVA